MGREEDLFFFFFVVVVVINKHPNIEKYRSVRI